MSTPSYDNAVAFTKADIDALRNMVIALRDKLNTHIGEGGSLHPSATINKPGFMSAATYTDLVSTLPNLYNTAVATIAANNLPTGTTCWFYGSPEDLPTGWHLTSANSSNKLYPITTQADGGSLRGVISNTETPGTIETISGVASSHITTVALYSIRKD